MFALRLWVRVIFNGYTTLMMKKIFWREKTPRAYANAYGGDSTLYQSHLDQQVWVSDGTEAGTHLLKFINKKVDATSGEGTNTQAAWPYVYKDQLYFRADDGSHGVELWCERHVE